MKCEDCGKELTEENKAKYLDLCKTCDAIDRDNLAWLTGTGKYAQ